MALPSASLGCSNLLLLLLPPICLLSMSLFMQERERERERHARRVSSRSRSSRASWALPHWGMDGWIDCVSGWVDGPHIKEEEEDEENETSKKKLILPAVSTLSLQNFCKRNPEPLTFFLHLLSLNPSKQLGIFQPHLNFA